MDEPLSNQKFREALLALGAEDVNHRIEAINALGFSRRLEAIKPLKQVFRDGGNILRSYARQALTRLENDLKALNIDITAEVAERPAESAPAEGAPDEAPPAINLDKLRDLLASNDPKIRSGAVQAAAQLESRSALPLLRERLAVEYHLFVVASLVINIGKLGDPADLPRLYPFLKHDDERVRANAVEAINYIGRGIDAALLIPLLKDPSERVATAAAKALARVDPTTVSEEAAVLAASGDESARQSAEFLKSVREEPKPKFVRAAVKPKRNTGPWVLAGVALLALAAAAGYKIYGRRPPAVEAPVAVAPARGGPTDKELAAGVAETDRLVGEGRLDLAEIKLKLLLKTFGERDILRLVYGEIQGLRSNLPAARDAIERLDLPDPLRSRGLLALARIEVAAGNERKALELLGELAKRRPDRFTEAGATLDASIRARFRELDRKLVERTAARYRDLVAAIDAGGPAAAEPFFHRKGFAPYRAALLAAAPEARRFHFMARTFEISIERGRSGIEVAVETLELVHALLPGNSPLLAPVHRLYHFTADEPPAVLTAETLTASRRLADPLLPLAHAGPAAARNPVAGATALAEALRASPDSGYVRLALAEAWQAQDRADLVQEALGSTETGLRFDPPFRFGDGRLRGRQLDLLANARLAQGDRAGYLSGLARAAEADPENALVLLELYGEARAAGDAARTADLAKRLLAASPDFPPFDRLAWPEAYAGTLAAESLIAAGNLKDAAETLTALMQRQPDCWRLPFLMGEAFAALDRSDQAIAMYEKALALNPRNDRILGRLALALQANEEFDEAKRRADEALAIDDSRENREILKRVGKRNGR